MKQDYQKIRMDLKRAGCSAQAIEQIVEALEQSNIKQAEGLMRIERCRCLNEMHEAQKKVDALDYTIYCVCKQKDGHH